MIARIALFSIIGAVLLLSGFHTLALAEGLLGGALLGAGLGVVGLKLTRFEVDPHRGDCYVPNPWMGGLLTVLLLGRLAWRFLIVMPQMEHDMAAAQAQGHGAHTMPIGYASSPLTMLVIGLIVGYYIFYFAGLLVHHRRFQQARPAGSAADLG